ncbi:hypothetical protein TWF718_004566 [Orbilia javanica]|uniref:F-box domain-containing protein n=1 Tax=Orbilia javanica TaxID=47235 RepID=A0AAN8N6F3_9PEZI
MARSCSLDELPVELHHHIVSYLDKDSAKSLRLAYATPKIIAATGVVLFETLVLRLGNHRSSRTILNNLRSCLLTLNDEVDLDTNRILPHVRTLVVDTRYPFVVTDELISTRTEWRMPNSGFSLSECAENVPSEEVASFLDLFEKVFSTTWGRLKVLKWQTSEFPPILAHNQIAELLLSPAILTRKKYEFTISHNFSTPSTLTQYLQNLSSCDRLEVIGQYTKNEEIDDENMNAVAQLIRRCDKLKSLHYCFENGLMIIVSTFSGTQ